jgi:hypothetical protein
MTKNKFASEAKGDVCVWQDDVEGYWAGNCGIHWCLEEGTPKGERHEFLPKVRQAFGAKGGSK